jgi:16S rRNA (uracil1498-N3)-methyltransferase
MSSIPRLFVEHPLAAGAAVPLTPAQARYLGTVLRRRAGAALRLFNGRDGEWAAELDGGIARLGGRLRAQAGGPALSLVPAVLKRDAMGWLIEKATELGVARIAPVLAARSVPDRVAPERLAAIAQEAAEQCERLDLPVIEAALPLAARLAAWDGTPLLAAVERQAAPSLAAVAARLRPPLALLTGPEGGLSGAELDELGRHPFVTAVALGPRILRAETAAVAGLAILQAACGDLV